MAQRNPRQQRGLRVAFGCEARVGKDMAAQHLQTKYGGTILAFATPLHDILRYAQERLGLPAASKETHRGLLQAAGDWAKRVGGSAVFVARLFADMEIACADAPRGHNVYVSDVRFPAEFCALKAAGFYLVRITRAKRHVSSDLRVAGHPSEHSLLDWARDATIANNGSVEELHSQLDQLCARPS